MKKTVFLLLVSILFLLYSFCYAEIEGSGTTLVTFENFGKSQNEILILSRQIGKIYNQYGYIEDTVFEQAFTRVYYFYTEKDAEFDIANLNELRIGIATIRSFSQKTSQEEFDKVIGQYSPYKEIKVEHTDDDELTQISCLITADARLSTAAKTFEEVESILQNMYGETRYTYRRGIALPCIAGYYNIPPIIMRSALQFSIVDYSHRIIEYEDVFNVIDHHIIVNTDENILYHQVNFTRCPIDISK